MSEKHRNLPQWMVKSNAQSRDDNDDGKTTKRTAKKRLKSVVTYWMNEKELLETALAILKDEKSQTCAVQAQEEMSVIPETDEDDDDDDGEVDDEDRTRVSNIAEQETVPYANYVEEKTSIKPGCHLKASPDDSEPSQKHNEDDEALKLVREIFFT